MTRKVEVNGLSLEVLEEGETVEGAVILVSRKADMPVAHTGSSEDRCDWCGEAVWIHSSSRAGAPDAKIKCAQCFMAAIKQETN